MYRDAPCIAFALPLRQASSSHSASEAKPAFMAAVRRTSTALRYFSTESIVDQRMRADADPASASTIPANDANFRAASFHFITTPPCIGSGRIESRCVAGALAIGKFPGLFLARAGRGSGEAGHCGRELVRVRYICLT